MQVHINLQRRLNKMKSMISNRPIPGQSLTTTPKNAQYEQPPLIVNPEEALQIHLTRLSKPRSMEDMLEFIEGGVDIRTIVEGILRGAVLNGVHSIDVSLIIAPVLHEFIRGLPLAAGIDFEDGFEDQQDVDEAMYRIKKPFKDVPKEIVEEEEIPEKSSGLMARR